jgi:hypothetical protein
VKKTLEPILAALGDKPTPQQILDLKVCDPAVGSGAFLVEACRQLGDALVAAWAHHGDKPGIPPDEDELLHARRLVAQRCLYGVDRNPMATDLAKLSLWLATLAKDHPFTFLDHSLRSGDALVGLSKKQIIAFHWDLTSDQAKQRQLGEDQLEKSIELAINKRIGILEGGDHMLPGFKADLLQAADNALEKARRTGDLCLAAFFNGDKPKARAALRERYLDTLIEIASTKDLEENFTKTNEVKATVAQLRQGAPHSVLPFHWEIEFPEVFARSNSGFDAFIGNPPFSGVTALSESNHEFYTDWLRISFQDSGGKCDLVAFFFRLAFALLRRDGAFGLIATNTISQGDTRRSSLTVLRRQVATIFSAKKNYSWPGVAAVMVSVVHIYKGELPPGIAPTLDEKEVERITSFLFASGGDEDPAVLTASRGQAFLGSKVQGIGFTFDNDNPKCPPLVERDRVVALNSRNAERIRPFLGGEELNSDPLHRAARLVIDLNDLAEADRHVWPDLFALVEKHVRPDRVHSGGSLAARWWQYGHQAKELYIAIQGLERVLVVARVTQHLGFTFVRTNQVLNDKVVVVATDRFAPFCLLSSRVHEGWTRFFCSTLEDRLNYSPSDCFETFPFPTGWETDTALEAAGQAYYEFRAELMVANNEGLTKTYNRFHSDDPEDSTDGIRRLRELHAALDHAVLIAYGWSDLLETGRTTCDFFPDYYDEPEEEGGDPIPQSIRYRWPDATRDEVLARLLKLNAERHAQEVRQGLHSSSAQKATKKTATKKAAKKVAQEPPRSAPIPNKDKPPLAQGSLQFGAEDLELFGKKK